MEPAASPQLDAQIEQAHNQTDHHSVLNPLQPTYDQGVSQPGGMNFDLPQHSQDTVTVGGDGHGFVPMIQLDAHQTRDESSEDDGPIMAHRKLREPVKERRPDGRGLNNYPRRSAMRQPQQSSPIATGRSRKKLGPKAWAAKPIMKNDLKAKMEVIREIESLWGKGFIKAYIPKCHRPLVKRGKGGKRAVYRDHETNAINWLPSVLKAILNLAKLTDDKKWLKQAMNDVVRHRIKHTGNRKPQLVTTDFDIIEDMLIKDWDVEYSFEIRYKHLLVNGKDEVENDENIDHILDAGSDRDGSEQENNEGMEDQENSDGSSEYEDGGRGGISGKYLQSSGYTKGSHFLGPTPNRQQQKPRTNAPVKKAQFSQSPPVQQPDMYGYNHQTPSYGPPLDPWGRPMPMSIHGYGLGPGGHPGGYNAYSGYSLSYGREDLPASQHPATRGMLQYPPPLHTITRARNMPGSDHSSRGSNAYKRGNDSSLLQTYSQAYNNGRIKIKRESPGHDERPMPLQDFDGPTNDLGAQDNEDEEDDTDLDAQLEAAEIQLKIAKIKAKIGRRK